MLFLRGFQHTRRLATLLGALFLWSSVILVVQGLNAQINVETREEEQEEEGSGKELSAKLTLEAALSKRRACVLPRLEATGTVAQLGAPRVCSPETTAPPRPSAPRQLL